MTSGFDINYTFDTKIWLYTFLKQKLSSYNYLRTYNFETTYCIWLNACSFRSKRLRCLWWLGAGSGGSYGNAISCAIFAIMKVPGWGKWIRVREPGKS